MKKSQHKKVVKAKRVKKRQNLKSGSVLKKQRPSKLRTLANQIRSLPPMLKGPLPN